MEYRDYYATLGVPRTATQPEIRKAFRSLARAHHPDVNPDDAAAEARFKELNEAYDVLSDPEKRKRYDALGADWERYREAGAPGGAGGPFAGASGFPGGMRFEYRGNPEDLAGFSDFFRTYFGGGGGDETADPSPRRGGRTRRSMGGFGDLFGGGGGETGASSTTHRGSVTISLEEVATGSQAIVQAGERRLEVKIPAGIEDGKTIRIGGDDGPILLAVHVRPHAVYTREGADLQRELPVTLGEALLGGEVPVGTLAGRTLMLTLPAGTQPGRTFRLRGQGLPRFRAEGRGDLLVTVRVRIPEHLDAEGRRLAEAFLEHAAQPDPRGGRPAPTHAG